MPPKRKRSSVATATDELPNWLHDTPIPPPRYVPPLKKRESRRGKVDTNPDHNPEIVDGKYALRASPDADEEGQAFDAASLAQPEVNTNGHFEKDIKAAPSTVELENPSSTPAQKQKKSPTKSSIAAKKGSDEIKAFRAEQAAKKQAEVKVKKEEDVNEWDKRRDPDGDEEGPAQDAEIMKLEARRPPPVNSDYLPLPWKGRLGYVSISSLMESFRADS